MKKISMETLINYITANGISELSEIKDELVAELAKGKAKADANREQYADYHDKVIEALTSANAPLTAQEIADETGIARGKIVYGLKNYWNDEVDVDTTGKSNMYTIKA